MTAFALPALYALFAWWFSTGAILFLDGLPRRTFRWSMAGATVVLGLSVYGLLSSRGDPSAAGAYLAFTSGLLIWGWLEMTYYMGFVTGPRREPCPQGCAGWRHFGHAVASSLYHELATIGLAAALYAATRDMPNQIGLWTFVILWGMQISAKLNVFLGVPNVSEDFLPEHLSFLKSFLTRKPMNLLFPVSITLSVVLATLVVEKAFAAQTGGFEATGYAFLGALMVLAILEHWFLVLPLRAEALWGWSRVPRDIPPLAGAAPAEAGDAHENFCNCRQHANGAVSREGWPARGFLDKPFFRKRTTGLPVDTPLVKIQPSMKVQPSMARRHR